MENVSSMKIEGYQGYNIANTFIKQEGESKGLAILFPGAGYRATMPLLYYPERLLNWLGFDVLRIDHSPHLDIPEFSELSNEDKKAWIFADASHIGRAVLDEHSPKQTILLGKSIGTLALGHLVANYPEFKQGMCIWLTPLLKVPLLVEQIQASKNPSLFVIGTADTHYDTDLLASILKEPHHQSIVLKDADHSLNVNQDIHSSLLTLQEVMGAIERFLLTYSAV